MIVFWTIPTNTVIIIFGMNFFKKKNKIKNSIWGHFFNISAIYKNRFVLFNIFKYFIENLNSFSHVFYKAENWW